MLKFDLQAWWGFFVKPMTYSITVAAGFAPKAHFNFGSATQQDCGTGALRPNGLAKARPGNPLSSLHR
jgi:hypothetical protein